MPTRRDYSVIVRRELKPYLDQPGNAWKGIYRLLMWYEHGVPHIIDADKLKLGAWRERAKLVEKTLATSFGCKVPEIPAIVDRLVYSEIFSTPPQRQNPLGIGFVEALLYFLETFSGDICTFYP